jgi:NAD(P)H-dependent FMN reductase
MKLLGISGGMSQHTIVAVEKALEYAHQYDNSVQTEALNISEYDIQYCDGRDPAEYEGDAKLIIDKIVNADAYFIGTPMYRGSYTGMLKNVFDIIPNDALIGKPVGLIATGGSNHHYLALEQELRPLLIFFYAYVVPGSVYINNKQLSASAYFVEEVLAHLKQLAKSVVNLNKYLPSDKSEVVGPLGPSTYYQKRLSE